MTQDEPLSRAAAFDVLAQAAFTRQGYHAVSMQDLLRRAGLSHLPGRYRSKADVYEALMGQSPPPVGKERVRAAAAQVFADGGYFRATVRRVASAADMASYSVLRLYPDKATLWTETMGQPPPSGALTTGWAGARVAQAKETQVRILAVAKAEFEAQVYDAVSIRGVAKAAGVSTGAVMGNFPTKEALWRAAMGCPPPGDHGSTGARRSSWPRSRRC